MDAMESVVRLVTSLDVEGDVGDDRRMAISARHDAELASGRRVLLLDDRGWSASGPPDVWTHTTVEQIADLARTVVGPDEPPHGLSPTDMAADHWSEMARRLRRAGVDADPGELGRLPHDVVMSERLLRPLRVAWASPAPVEREKSVVLRSSRHPGTGRS